MKPWMVEAEFVPDNDGGHLVHNNIKFVNEKLVERTAFAEIIVRLKQRGVITEADAVRWAEAEVAYGG